MKPESTIDDALDAVTDYVLANKDRIRDPRFHAGDRETVRTGLAFHALQGTLRVEWSNNNSELGTRNSELPRPAGLCILWQDHRDHILEREAAGEEVFHWQKTDPAGDCLYVGLVITTAPGVLARLAAWFRRRFPALPEFAHRRGRLVRFHWLDRLSQNPKPETRNPELCYV